MNNKTSVYLSAKPRYEILDGLRGVAAIIVVAFHLFETYSAGPVFQTLNHGYLAVDFFFLLSGFVIGYAYDDRWDRMTLWDFAKRRLVRLHPMVVMGTLVGMFLFYLGDFPGFPMLLQTEWWKVLWVALIGILMLPAIPSWDIRGDGGITPLNGAAWSLMWEYIANILYALFIRRFSNRMLAAFVGFSAILTLILCLDIDLFGVLALRSYARYTVIGGWGLTADQLYIGITRLLFPFFAGLLLSRINRPVEVKRGFWWCSFLITAILVMPYAGTSESPWLDGAYNAVSILLLFPLIVMMGAGSTVTGRFSASVCRFLGDISYPLYITHYPLIYVQMGWAASHPDAPAGMHIFMAVSMFVIAMGLAYACLKLYDEPVREWLKQRFLMRRN